MSTKSLKDIVEDGFGKLSVLSEKRKELLQRCDELAGGVAGPRVQQGAQKLESTENTYSAEITAHVDRSQEVLQQTLSQIVEDNERFFSSVKENLQLRIARVIKELAHSREWLLASSTEKFDSSLRPLEREMEAGKTDLRFQAVKLLGELESSCKRSQSSLHEAQAEIAGRLSASEHDLTGTLGSDFGTMVQEAEKRRHQVTASLEKLYSEQTAQMTNLTEELDERITLVVAKNLETVKELGAESELALDQFRDDIVAAAAGEIVASSQESFSELESSYEYSHHELSEKLTELRGQSDRLLDQVKEFLQDLEDGIRGNSEKIETDLKNKPTEDPVGSLSLRNPVEESIKQFSRELDASAADFKRQLNELLKIQTERLSNLNASAESSISAAAQALNTELKQMTRLHDQTYSEREQELLARLRKLEKDAQETSTLVSEGLQVTDDEDGGIR